LPPRELPAELSRLPPSKADDWKSDEQRQRAAAVCVVNEGVEKAGQDPGPEALGPRPRAWWCVPSYLRIAAESITRSGSSPTRDPGTACS